MLRARPAASCTGSTSWGLGNLIKHSNPTVCPPPFPTGRWQPRDHRPQGRRRGARDQPRRHSARFLQVRPLACTIARSAASQCTFPFCWRSGQLAAQCQTASYAASCGQPLTLCSPDAPPTPRPPRAAPRARCCCTISNPAPASARSPPRAPCARRCTSAPWTATRSLRRATTAASWCGARGGGQFFTSCGGCTGWVVAAPLGCLCSVCCPQPLADIPCRHATGL